MSLIEYRKYKITTITELLGSIPANDEIYRDFILSKSPDAGDPHSDETESVPSKHEVDPDEEFKNAVTAFYRHPKGDGLVLYDYQFMGFLKDAANTLKDSPHMSAKQKKNLRAKVQKYAWVYPRMILIADQPDGIRQRPLMAQTRQGPRVALAASERLDPPVEFEVIIGLVTNEVGVDWPLIDKLLRYGQVHGGLLQWRSGGCGKFQAEMVKEIKNPEKEGLAEL
jgi:hypothetical protein